MTINFVNTDGVPLATFKDFHGQIKPGEQVYLNVHNNGKGQQDEAFELAIGPYFVKDVSWPRFDSKFIHPWPSHESLDQCISQIVVVEAMRQSYAEHEFVATDKICPMFRVFRPGDKVTFNDCLCRVVKGIPSHIDFEIAKRVMVHNYIVDLWPLDEVSDIGNGAGGTISVSSNNALLKPVQIPQSDDL